MALTKVTFKSRNTKLVPDGQYVASWVFDDLPWSIVIRIKGGEVDSVYERVNDEWVPGYNFINPDMTMVEFHTLRNIPANEKETQA